MRCSRYDNGGRMRVIGCWWKKDGWCEGGLGQQRNDGLGWATMRERSEVVETPATNVTEWVSRGHFYFARCSFGQSSYALVLVNTQYCKNVCCRDTILQKCVSMAPLFTTVLILCFWKWIAQRRLPFAHL